MDSSINSYVWAILLSAILALPFAANADDAPELTGKQIFERCGYKYPGEDQQGKFTVILQDKEGKVLKREYLRYWKDYKGADGVADKMLLFTLYPPEAKGSTFMRVAYAQRDKPVDQWFNQASPRLKSGEIDPTALTEPAALALMLADPVLIRRPLLRVGERREAGFDQETVDAWIGLASGKEGVSDVCLRTEASAAPKCKTPA